MAVTISFLQEKIENIFRQDWMKNDDWNTYYSFLISKGFNYDEVLNGLSHTNDNDSMHWLTNYINDYVEGLLRKC